MQTKAVPWIIGWSLWDRPWLWWGHVWWGTGLSSSSASHLPSLHDWNVSWPLKSSLSHSEVSGVILTARQSALRLALLRTERGREKSRHTNCRSDRELSCVSSSFDTVVSGHHSPLSEFRSLESDSLTAILIISSKSRPGLQRFS
jgi:hypothetical protein